VAKKKSKKKVAKKVSKKTTQKKAIKKTAAKPARRGLSRGLGALLGSGRSKKPATVESPQAIEVTVNKSEVATTEESSRQQSVDLKNGQLTTLPIELLQRGRYQPRQSMKQEALEELAASIKQQGIMQPIVVRAVSKDKYEIIAGERRWRAAQIALLQDVPVIIRQIADEDAIAMALIENIQRENLNAIDEALALHRLIEEFELTHDEAARAVGRSRTSVTNLLRLMDLEPSVKKLLANDELGMGHARALLSLPTLKQLAAAKDVIKKGLSVRATEALVKSLSSTQGKPTKKSKVKDPDIQRLENELTDKLGAQVSIDDKKGKGQLVITYTTLEELDGILDKIR